MERRVLLAIVLSFLVIYVYQALLVKPVPKPGPAPQRQSSPSGSGATTPPPSPVEAPSSNETSPTTPVSSAVPVLADTAERDVRIETADVIATFTNRGGRLKSWRLKHFADEKGEPVELVSHEFGDAQPLPFSLRLPDSAATRTVNSALYAISSPPGSQGPIASPTDVRFEYKDNAGLSVSKQFRLEPTSYIMSFAAAVNLGEKPIVAAIEWGPGLGDVDSATGRYAVRPRGLLTPVSAVKDVQRLAAADIAKQATYPGDFLFAGVDDHYFMSTALQAGPSTISFKDLTIPPPAESKTPPRELMSYTLEPARLDAPIRFYVGPKAFDVLYSIDPNLTNAIDFGFFRIIVAPLLRTLNSINGVIGNYGWSIVLLTVVINLILFPLRHKQVVSMRKLQAIQPEIKAIQDRYAKLQATDPARRRGNQEMMQLYQDRGVNPAAGCVPMLLPFPVLLAFYALLTTAIELRGAPWAGWIHDLSRPDPYYITPVFMVVSQVVQQWMMPAAGVDPTQQKMMLVMPLVLGFIFLSFPSGVVLYWIVNSVWTIGQQVLTNKLIGPAPTKNPRPPAERQLKVKT